MSAAKRERLQATPLEPQRLATITERFPYFTTLSEADRRELVGHVQVFLAEKNFEGCGGLELTDEVKLTIAVQACLLLLHRETDYYPACTSILVYPAAYRGRTHTRVGPGTAIEHDQARLGESHERGVVVLSWTDVRQGAAGKEDGRNVVFHEFAHQLDQEDGAADGVPVLEGRAGYAPWARVFQAEFDTLADATERGRGSDIDAYGATSPAEFFAVVTEMFFEKPETLAKNHPHLYGQLSSYYRQDPLARLGIAFEAPTSDLPSVEKRAPKVEKAESTVSLGILRDPEAARLVGVTPAFRESVTALGCEPRGWLSTVHRFAERRWGFVAEVFACPDPTVVAATYVVAGTDNGVAFWTLLDNGTIVDTEMTYPRTRWMGFIVRISPRQYREHLFIRGVEAPPATIYAKHVARVQAIAQREGTTPLARDPLKTYAACRLRSVDLLMTFMARSTRLSPALSLVIGVVVAIALAHRAEPLTRQSFQGAVVLGALGALLFGTFGTKVVLFLEQMRARGGRLPAEKLFADAAERVRERKVASIAADLQPEEAPH